MMKNKKGISPIIATVLLIAIAIALFLLIFLWIKSFQAEQVSKFGAPIENACPNIQLQFTVLTGNQLQIENTGDVPVYKVDIFKVSGGSSTRINTETIDLLAGKTADPITLESCENSLKIIPILLGKTSSGANKEYTCKNRVFSVSCA